MKRHSCQPGERSTWSALPPALVNVSDKALKFLIAGPKTFSSSNEFINIGLFSLFHLFRDDFLGGLVLPKVAVALRHFLFRSLLRRPCIPSIGLAHDLLRQNNSFIGCTLKSARGRVRFCGPGSSRCGSTPSP